MAPNILRGGHSLTVFNRTPQKSAELGREGARVAESAAECAKRQEVVVTMLADPEVVEGVAVGDGMLGAMRRDAVWIDCSTVNPTFTRRMGETAARHGVRFLDAPVAGTRGPAEKGELTILIGGDPAVVEEVRPVLDLVGSKIIPTGDVGSGTSMKMVVNLMLANAMAAFSEALTLVESLGIPIGKVADALIGGPVTAPFLAAKRTKIEGADYTPDFPLRLMQKDLHLVATEAYEHQIALPTSNAAKELYALAVRSGHGDLDFSAVYRALSPGSRPSR